MKLILLHMEITCITWFHMYAHYLESVKSIDQTAMLQDLRVVFLHELSTDSRLSILGIYLLHKRTCFLLLQHWDLMTQLVILRLVTVKLHDCIMHHQINKLAHNFYAGWKAV